MRCLSNDGRSLSDISVFEGNRNETCKFRRMDGFAVEYEGDTREAIYVTSRYVIKELSIDVDDRWRM